MAKEPLRLRVDDAPTYWNKENLIGTWVFPIGNVVGAMMGKERMEREQKEGRIVKEPTVLNIDMLVGATVGSLLSIFTAMAGAAIGGAIGLTMGKEAMVALANLGMVGGGLSAVPIGAYIGGIMGKDRMQKEYAQAQEQQRTRELQQYRGRDPQAGLELEHAVERRQDFVKTLEDKRATEASLGISK